MTEQTPTPGKVAQLTPEEWKQLVLLNNAQLQNYLQAVPGNTEGGASGLTDEHMALVDTHIARGRAFMRAWSLAKIAVVGATPAPQPEVQPAQSQTQAAQPAAANGAASKKGGWPKGRKRTRTPKQPEAGQ